MFFSSKCFSTIHTIIRSLRFNAHVKFDVSVEVLSSAVSFGTPLICTVQKTLGGVIATATMWALVVSVGVERIENCHGDGTICVLVLATLVQVEHVRSCSNTMKILLMPC